MNNFGLRKGYRYLLKERGNLGSYVVEEITKLAIKLIDDNNNIRWVSKVYFKNIWVKVECLGKVKNQKINL